MKPRPTSMATLTGSCTTCPDRKPGPNLSPSRGRLVTPWLPHGAPRARTSRRTWSLPERLAILPLPAPPASTLASATSDQPPHPAATPPNTPMLEPLPVSTDPLEAQAQALVARLPPALSWTRPGHGASQRTGARHAAPDGAWRAKAHFLLTYAQQTAPETAYQPKFFGGILPYLPEALAAYDAQARQAAQRRTQQAAAREQRRAMSATWPGSRNNVPSCGRRCPARH